MEENITIKLFLKFGQYEHIQDMFENGTIYMNSIEYFRKYHDEQLRGDKFEGISKLTNIPGGKLEVPSIDYKGEFISLRLWEHYEEVIGNIYSLYAVSSHGFPNPLEFKVHEKNGGFGTHCLMIKDNPRFLSLIEGKLAQLGLRYRHGFVKYYDPNSYTGKVNLFQKSNDYEYQKEFRFYVASGDTKPLVFQIGSLKDIAVIHKIDDIINTLKLVPTSTIS